jgi:hypothetical protein
MRAAGYGVAAHAASWLLQPPVLYLTIDTVRST